MLIDVKSFTSGPRHIENAVETQQNANHIAVAQCINGYIESFQSQFLRLAVGVKWCSLFDAYSRKDHEEPDENMESLIDMLREPFADYVFFHMLRDMNTQATITGLVQLKCANSYVSPLNKGVHTWNRMVDSMKAFSEKVAELQVNDVCVDADLLTYINNLNL